MTGTTAGGPLVLADARAVLRDACTRVVSDHQDFWAMASLTDCSYEDGIHKGWKYAERVDQYEEFGAPAPVLAQLRTGINGLLEAMLNADTRTNGPARRKLGKGQDLEFRLIGDTGTPNRVEVKLSFDATYKKYYADIADDVRKLAEVRTAGFAGCLHLAVFLVQLPKFRFPAGIWRTAPNGTGGRHEWIVYGSIKEQFGHAVAAIGRAPDWPPDSPAMHPLCGVSPEVLATLRARYAAVFRPSSPWTFCPDTHLSDAAIGVAIWEIP